jgi:hypothetical protein
MERFYQTLKKWLTGQTRAHTLADLNEQLAKFRHIYNHERPRGPWTDAHPPPPTQRHRKPARPGPTRETTGDAASTAWTGSGNSRSATPDGYATSASDGLTPANTS